MKHLFIINPQAMLISGRVDEIEDDIRSFFQSNPRLEYSIHVSRWKRDASGYTQRYVSNAGELVRVYAMGGNGTLFEVINGVVGLPNAQVAWYPLGNDNSMLYAFGGRENLSAFQSLQNLSLSPVITLDTIRAGNHYMTINGLIGGEAQAFRQGEILSKKTKLSRNFCYMAAGFFNGLRKSNLQYYYIETERIKIEGNFRSILVTNLPAYGAGIKPAVDALFNDGYMDVYIMQDIPKSKFFLVLKDYETGRYQKWPEYISHHRCKKFRVSSGSSMTMSFDGSLFYDTSMNFEICPHSLDFVCPPGINIPSASLFEEVSGSEGVSSEQTAASLLDLGYFNGAQE
jgi:diacylglycerol kinase family enzyme